MTAPDRHPRHADMALPDAASPLTDDAALEHLLSLAGPAGAPALLHQIGVDLVSVERDLHAALADGDAKAIRAATHVLIALAGTVGAPRLQQAAIAANMAAHAADSRAPAPAVSAALMEDLARLIDDIASRHRKWKAA